MEIIMKTAILGAWHVHTGGYAKAFAATPGCVIAAVWDSDRNRAEDLSKKFGCPWYTDIDALFSSEDFDSVIVCSATSEHPEVIKKAVSAGKHVFTEKVLTVSPDDAETIAGLVKKNGVKFVISFPHKCSGQLRYARQLVGSGALGEITYMRVRNAHDGSISNWLPPHFYDGSQCGGGAMIDLGAHPMYLIPWFMGEPESISSVFTNVTDRAVEDNAVSVFRYKNGAIAVSETGFVSKYNNYVIEIDGTKGSFRLSDSGAQYATDETGGKWIDVEKLPAEPSPLEQWIKLVRTGEGAEDFGIDEAVRLTRVMDAAYRSYSSQSAASYR